MAVDSVLYCELAVIRQLLAFEKEGGGGVKAYSSWPRSLDASLFSDI